MPKKENNICPICGKKVRRDKESFTCPSEYNFQICHLECYFNRTKHFTPQRVEIDNEKKESPA
jgi:hypothetical protein